MSKLDKAIEELKQKIENPSTLCTFIGGPWDKREYLIPDKHTTLDIPDTKITSTGVWKYTTAIYNKEENNVFRYQYTE